MPKSSSKSNVFGRDLFRFDEVLYTTNIKSPQKIARERLTAYIPVKHPEKPMFEMKPIAHVRSPYTDKGQVPKGPGAKHEAEGVIEFLPEFEKGLTDIEGFSHLFVIWVFDRSQGYDLMSQPPTASKPHGLFSTRSPRRPNPIGLTVVKLLNREGRAIRVQGVDMLDGTPVLDVKPYLSGVDPHELKKGWMDMECQ